MHVAQWIFSSTFIHYQLSSTFNHVHLLSSTFIHFYPFHPHSSTYVHFLPLSFTFIQSLPPGVTYKQDWMGLGWMDGWSSDCQYSLIRAPLCGANKYCICAPPKQGMYSEIHPRHPRDFQRQERFPESVGVWISQFLQSFGWITDILSSSIHLEGWIRKAIPLGQLGLTVLKSILPSLLMMREFPTG